MQVLVIGRTGQLARALAFCSDEGLAVSFCGRKTADLMIPGQAARAIRHARPDVVINAAAYTAVEKAEGDATAAFRVNGMAVGEIAAAAAEVGAALIHFSTDYVFDGARRSAYREADPTCPINVYGASKRAGEIAGLAANARTVILRTSWVYSPWGGNFVLTMLRLAGEQRHLRVVGDQVGTPTSALDLAEACLRIVPRLASETTGAPIWGLYHYAARGVCSWAEFASEIFAQSANLGAPLPIQTPKVAAVTSGEYPTKAQRPGNSALDSAKFTGAFGIAVPTWQSALNRVLEIAAADLAGQP